MPGSIGESVMGFVSNIWRVHYPKPEAQEAVKEEIAKNEVVLDKDAVDPARDVHDGDAKQMGVYLAEVAHAQTGKSFYLLFAFLMVGSFVNLLDNQITYTTTMTAAQYVFNSTAGTTAISLQSVILAVAKPFIGKFADVFGRSYAFFIVTIFYTVGFIVMATSQKMSDYFGGIVLWAVGNSGLNMLIYLILADFLSARTRAFGIGVISTPMFITFAVGPKIAGALLSADADNTYHHWRWAPGMFCILVPFVMLPTCVLLFWHEQTAKKNNLVPEHPYKRLGLWKGFLQFLIDVDAIGILWLATGWLFLLLPLGLGPSQADGYKTHWVIGLMVVGAVLILTVPLCEVYLSPRPFIRRQWLNSDVIMSMLLGFFDHMAFQISFAPLMYWVPMNLGFTDTSTINYFTYTQSLCLTFFAITAGLIVVYIRRFKWILVGGSAIRLLGTGLMMRYRRAGTTVVQAVWPQILQGLGGGVQGVLLETASQVAVRHQDVSMVLAAVLMIFELGGAIGTAIYSAIINDQFPVKLLQYIPAEAASGLTYLSWRTAPEGIREGIIHAFNDAVMLALTAAIAFVSVCIVCALFIRDWKLPKSHNVLSNEMPEKNFLKNTTAKVVEGDLDSSLEKRSYE
ncbi:hypothetical protein MCUN1_002867 [Malassezia cuniculi]|uniref:Major facilitator superfamily (MFS) profile domain-containing protein n=1 Tax=Malassezia cuniculi TaxID=948313 RepID=A0AAF0EXA0_9BASI|nr:hypothetical protein MCUN1_002867 [Malassezia cuniculi]